MPALQVRASSVDDAVIDSHAAVPELIASHGQANSSYTAALLNKDGQLVDWSLHEERLASGIMQLHAHSSPLYAALMSHLETKADLDAVQQSVADSTRPVVLKALKLYTTQAPWGPALVFCMAADPAPDTRALTIPLVIHVLVRPILAQQQTASVEVAVMGPCRRLPHVKHTSWVSERVPLEQRKPAGAAEVLLMDDTGAIMEGMTSNFAVVQGQEGSDRVHLRVAGPDQPALQGIAMRRVVQAAEQQGIAVVFKAPLLKEQGLWREAFITNCVRGLQPVSRIYTPANQGPDSLDLHLPPPVLGPVTIKLQAGMTMLQELLPFNELL